MLSLAAISISGMLLTSNIPSDSYSKQRKGCFSAIHRMQYTNRKENICFFSEKLAVKSSFFTTFASFLYKITKKKEKYIHK